MRILEVIALRGEQLSDPLWLERLDGPGLKDCFCLLGVDGVTASASGGGGTCRLESGQAVLLRNLENIVLNAPNTPEAPGTEPGFAGAVFFRAESSSGLQNILGFLERHQGTLLSPGIRTFYSRLYEQFAGQSVFSLQAAYHSLSSFLYELAEYAASHASSSGENVYIERALELMNMRVYGELSLKELADEVHLSEAHLIRIFRSGMQMSPMKYFARLKVHAAANMIIQGRRIKDVAERAGFYNDAHFSRQFKKYMGVSPREYKPQAAEIKKGRSGEAWRSISFLTSVLADFVDAIPDMVFFKDAFYVYRLCNAAFSEYVGLSKEDICGQTDFTIFPSDIAAFYRRYDGRVMRTRQAHANEEWVVYPDGRTFFLEAYKAPFFGPDQELLGIVAVCRDITERSGKGKLRAGPEARVGMDRHARK